MGATAFSFPLRLDPAADEDALAVVLAPALCPLELRFLVDGENGDCRGGLSLPLPSAELHPGVAAPAPGALCNEVGHANDSWGTSTCGDGAR
jgi:hypothetical protein